MPQKSWAVGEEVLAADFNTYVQGQICPSFTNVAQRDSQWTAPPNGAVCVTIDTGTFWQRIGNVWWKPGARITFNARTSNVGPQGPEADAGVSITVSPPAGRQIRLDAYVRGVNVTTNGVGIVRIREGTTELTSCQYPATAGGGGPGGLFGITLMPTAGSHTYRLTIEGAGGTATIQAAPTFPCYLEAIDLGAA